MSIKYVTFDTYLYDEEDNEIPVCVEAEIELGCSASFNPCRECYDPPESDEVDITEVYNYNTETKMKISEIDSKTIERFEEEALDELNK